MNIKKMNVFLIMVWLAVDFVQWLIHSSEYATITGIKAEVVHKRSVGRNWDKTGLCHDLIRKVINLFHNEQAREVQTIFSIVLVMVENWNMSSVLTTTAGVVKKNSTINRKLLIRNDLKYQNREGIAKFPLWRKNISLCKIGCEHYHIITS